LFSAPSSLRDIGESSDLFEEGGELIIRRIVSVDGKNKCYINDHMVTVKTLAEVGRHLLDLHGQHEHQSLFMASTHVHYLDKYSGDDLLRLRGLFQESAKGLRDRRQELASLKGAERELLAKRDLLQFQINEIEEACPEPAEDEGLTREREVLRNAERLFSVVVKAVHSISEGADFAPATDLIAGACDELRSVSQIDAGLDDVAGRVNSILIELEDCAAALKGYAAGLDFPPGRLQEVEDRLSLLALLKKKYGATIAEILEYHESAAHELMLCDTSGERIAKLESEIAEAQGTLAGLARELSAERRAAAKVFAAEVTKELEDLNMVNAEFKVLLTREQDGDGLPIDGERFKVFSHGVDRIEFMISANKGEPVKPLAKIASGGEVSRIMLALKIILADADAIPTLIFDEIDVGIGGKTAMAVGEKMSVLSRKHQVVAVTHLPQIASFADSHFSIEKKELGGKSITEVEELLEANRIREMARLLSGKVDSDLSLKHAEELLDRAANTKIREAHGRAN
jgi:DNA repair protein RecN (Recombination protein N)